jgi:DNA replication protein DnaC
MLKHLHGGRADGSFERRLQTYLRPDLLVLDDFGLRPLQSPGPEDLYEIIDARYEQSSIMLTSNRAPNGRICSATRSWPAQASIGFSIMRRRWRLT